MAIAAVFMLLARRMRPLEPRITITPCILNGLPADAALEAAPKEQSSDEDAMQFLITRGVRVRDVGEVRRIAAKNGVLYGANLSDCNEAMRQKKAYILGSSGACISRQLLSASATSGLIMAHMVSGSLVFDDDQSAPIPR